MTIPSETNKSGPYFYNGATTSFAYGFKISDETHIRVVETVVATGVETDLVLSTDYTVTGVGDDTGTFVISPARAAGKTVLAVREVPFTQQIVLENQGAYFAKVVEGALDNSVARDQQLQEQIDRAIKVSVSSDLSPDELIADLTAGSAAAVAAAVSTAADAAQTAADRVQTGADRTQTGLDRIATAADAVATAADRVQTGLDRTSVTTNKGLVDTAKAAVDVAKAATDANVVLTAADVVSAEADRVATAADRVQTGLDRVQTGLDRTAAAASAASVDPVLLATSSASRNLALTASVAAGALTISMKGFDGNNPSTMNPITVPFRSATSASGDMEAVSVTAATSLVISSGSTMGFTSASAGRLWIVGFNDGGTFRLGAVNCLSGVNIMALRDGIYSSTAEGGSGGADSAQVIYTGTAVASKALAILGYMEWSTGLTTSGTWAIVPTTIQLMGPGIAKPGDIIQNRRTDTGALASGTTLIPLDDTIPQNTEGTQFMSQAITPSSAPNILAVVASGNYSYSVDNSFVAQAIFRGATVNALATQVFFEPFNGSNVVINTSVNSLAGSVASTTFSLRAGGQNAGTTYFNGSVSGRRYGGNLNSYIEVQEIMA